MGGDVPTLLSNDAASCVAVAERMIALGTHVGSVHILDFLRNQGDDLMKKVVLHPGPFGLEFASEDFMLLDDRIWVNRHCGQDSGKLITWGSTDDLGQSYLTSGKHGETPEPFPLPKEVFLIRAAAGWAHCVCVTVAGEVYTWEWKECVPSGKFVGDPNTAQSQEKDVFERQIPSLTEQPISFSYLANHKNLKQKNRRNARVTHLVFL